MDNFNYQAYIKSGKIHKKSESLTEAQATGFGIGQGRSKTISKGKESNPDLKDTLKDKEPKKSKYFMKNGVPHKADGTPLKKMNKENTEAVDENTEAIEESSKMKVSELKAKIKETILAELSLNEADEEVDVDIDVEDEIDTDIEEPSTDSTSVGLSQDEQDIQDNLKLAYDNAVAIGDQKLADQIGNSITFFTRTHVVER
jgi:hypothetical protein